MHDRARSISLIASLIGLSCLAACASDGPAATGPVMQAPASQSAPGGPMTPHGY